MPSVFLLISKQEASLLIQHEIHIKFGGTLFLKFRNVLAAEGVLAVGRKGMLDKRLCTVGPADFHFLDFSVRAQSEVSHRSVERTVPATGFDLPHLVPLALRPVMDDHPASNAEPVASAIPQFENHTAVARLVVAVHFERTVLGIGDDIQIAVVVDIDICVSGAMIQIFQAEFPLRRQKRLPLLVMEKIVGGELLGDQYAIDHIQILPLVVVQISEARIPAPLRGLHMGVLGHILKTSARHALQ